MHGIIQLQAYEGKLFLLMLVLISLVVYLAFGNLKQTAAQPDLGNDGFSLSHQSFLSASSINLQEQEHLEPYTVSQESSQNLPSIQGQVIAPATMSPSSESANTIQAGPIDRQLHPKTKTGRLDKN